MNAVLQSLFACSPFRNFISSIPHPQNDAIEQSQEYLQAPTVVKLRDLMKKISTERICTDVESIYEIWTSHRGRADAYEDAMEFLDFLINKLDHEISTVS